MGVLDVQTISAMQEFQQVFGLAKSENITRELLGELNNAKVVEAPAELESRLDAVEPAPQLEASLTTPAAIEVPKEPEPAPEIIVEAQKTASEPARYPSVALRRGHDQNTTVVVAYDIATDGQVINPTIKSIVGAGRYKSAFEKAAIIAAEKASFSPKTVDGDAVLSEGHETKFTFNVE